jgi:hypothetical protein
MSFDKPKISRIEDHQFYLVRRETYLNPALFLREEYEKYCKTKEGTEPTRPTVHSHACP